MRVCYNKTMKIHIGADHAGFHLKESLKKWLLEEGHEVVDHGANTENQEDDYPDFIAPVARAIAGDPERSRGVILGGSGQGEAIVANRFPKVRAAVYYGGPEQIVTLAREHNDANILSLGARLLSFPDAKRAVSLFLMTPFSTQPRHARRLAKIENLKSNI